MNGCKNKRRNCRIESDTKTKGGGEEERIRPKEGDCTEKKQARRRQGERERTKHKRKERLIHKRKIWEKYKRGRDERKEDEREETTKGRLDERKQE